MRQCNQVAPQSVATIDVTFRTDTPNKVCKKVSYNQPKRVRKRHVTFANDICWIDDLRIPESKITALAAFDSEVNSPYLIRFNDPAEPAQRCTEIKIFLPA